MTDVAVCPKDHQPLVFTLEYPGAEYVCVVCDSAYEAFEPPRVPTSAELQTRHDELTDRYEREQAERMGRPVHPPRPEGVPPPVCSGCGRMPFPGEGRLDRAGKPSLWYVRTFNGEQQFACSRACISAGLVAPW